MFYSIAFCLMVAAVLTNGQDACTGRNNVTLDECAASFIEKWDGLKKQKPELDALTFPLLGLSAEELRSVCLRVEDVMEKCDSAVERCRSHPVPPLLRKNFLYPCSNKQKTLFSDEAACVLPAIASQQHCLMMLKTDDEEEPGAPKANDCTKIQRFFKCAYDQVQKSCSAKGAAALVHAIDRFGCDVQKLDTTIGSQPDPEECPLQEWQSVTDCFQPLLNMWVEARNNDSSLLDSAFPVFKFQRLDLIKMCQMVQSVREHCSAHILKCPGHQLPDFANAVLGLACGWQQSVFFLSYDCIRSVIAENVQCQPYAIGAWQPGHLKEVCGRMPLYYKCLEHPLEDKCGRDGANVLAQAIRQYGCELDINISVTDLPFPPPPPPPPSTSATGAAQPSPSPLPQLPESTDAVPLPPAPPAVLPPAPPAPLGPSILDFASPGSEGAPGSAFVRPPSAFAGPPGVAAPVTLLTPPPPPSPLPVVPSGPALVQGPAAPLFNQPIIAAPAQQPAAGEILQLNASTAAPIAVATQAAAAAETTSAAPSTAAPTTSAATQATPETPAAATSTISTIGTTTTTLASIITTAAVSSSVATSTSAAASAATNAVVTNAAVTNAAVTTAATAAITNATVTSGAVTSAAATEASTTTSQTTTTTATATTTTSSSSVNRNPVAPIPANSQLWSKCDSQRSDQVRTCLHPLFRRWSEVHTRMLLETHRGNLTFPIYHYSRNDIIELCAHYTDGFGQCPFSALQECLNDQIVFVANAVLGYACVPRNLNEMLRHMECMSRVITSRNQCADLINGPLLIDRLAVNRCTDVQAFYRCNKEAVTDNCTSVAGRIFRETVRQFGCEI